MIRRARYHFYRWLARTLWSFMGGLDVRGLENVPKSGAFLMISNHQSFLDPILVQAVCPRIVHSMAKSTQFGSSTFRRLLTQLYAFPVRRFEVDPQAVRQVLRRLRQGNGVVIYIEGERSWDGRLQPPRLGTVRVALHAKDREILERVGELIAPGHPVRDFTRRGGRGAPSPMSLLRVHSVEMVRDLGRHGVVPNKSLVYRPWDGPPGLLPAYWRGMIDGDGSWWLRGDGRRCGFALYGTGATCAGFAAFAAGVGATIHLRRRGTISITRSPACSSERDTALP